jgi:hypothetical protein
LRQPELDPASTAGADGQVLASQISISLLRPIGLTPRFQQ